VDEDRLKQPDRETPLTGGNVTVVARVGDTVHRAAGPWSSSVHDLLRYLEARGFDGAPRFLGFDDLGREVLTFMEGEVGRYPLASYMWSDEALTGAARLLRRYHDATSGYVPKDGALWQIQAPEPLAHEVICHNDVAPYNLVFVDGEPRALIDFDTAGPGPRIWDVAYAVYRFVPLSNDEHTRTLGLTRPPARGKRLRMFCDAYGLERDQRRELLENVERRLEALCGFIVRSAAGGDASYERAVGAGHVDLYRRDIESLRRRRTELEESLL
jgi:hypothetical protein